jgi:RimJ/RimL family protein N-acetyltransferase
MIQAMKQGKADSVRGPAKPLCGSRVTLKGIRLYDAWHLFWLHRDKAVGTYNSFSPISSKQTTDIDQWAARPGQVTRLLSFCRKGWEILSETLVGSRGGDSIRLGIFLTGEHKAVGLITLSICNSVKMYATFGIWIGKPYWGRGVGLEAERLLFQWSFEQLGIKYIMAEVHTENVASIVTMRKLGFKVTESGLPALDANGRRVQFLRFRLERKDLRHSQ